MKSVFSRQQRRVLTLCVVMYTTAYVCRLNLSAALSSILEVMNLSMAQGGMLQTLFAAIYAAGQFVNGAIVDRVNPARYMLAGLAGSAACNLIMGLCDAYPAMLAVWSLNAAFQSMLWTPVMRLLALYFREDHLRERANETIALTLIVGHFIAWAISGFVSAAAGWRFSFIVPAAVAACAIAAMCKICMTLKPLSLQSASNARTREPIVHVLAATGFFLVILTCMLYGFIRDSVITWTPTLLARISGGHALSSAAFTLILPVINIAGVLMGFCLRRRGARPHGVVALMMLSAIASSAALLGVSGMLLTAVLLGTICAAMYGANTMLTGLIPLEYDRVGRTSLTAGMVDSFIYIGSALAGVFGGSIFDAMGAHTLYGSWIVAGLLSAILMLLAMRMSCRYWNKH